MTSELSVEPRGVLTEWRLGDRHPLRRVREIADEAMSGLSSDLVVASWSLGRFGPRRLLRAALLMGLYDVRDAFQLSEQLGYNLLFRWFLDIERSEDLPGAEELVAEFQGLLEYEAARTFLRSVTETLAEEGLLRSEHFNVDRRRIREWLPRTQRESSMPGVDPRSLGTDGETCASGRFGWLELRATEPSLARAFYSTLFDWTVTNHAASSHGMFQHRSDVVGSIHELPALQRLVGVQPQWTPYVCVEDLDDAILRARRLGGEVERPREASDGGRSAVLIDGLGAQLGLWQPTAAARPVASNSLGTACWYEIVTDDFARARFFYGALLGWGGKAVRGAREYTSWTRDGVPIAGIRGNEPDYVGTLAAWVVYFAEPDIEARTLRAVELGGQIVIPPTDFGGGELMAVLVDPQGASFGLLQR